MEEYTFLQSQIDYGYSQERDAPVIYIFGTDKNSRPVTLEIHNYFPYVYAEPIGISSEEINDLFITNLRSALKFNYNKIHANKIEILKKQNIYGYTTGKRNFIKIYFNAPNGTTGFAKFLENGMKIENYGRIAFKVFESNVPYIMKFMIEKDINGMSYIKVLGEQITDDVSFNVCTQLKSETIIDEDLNILNDNYKDKIKNKGHVFLTADESNVFGLIQSGEFLKLPRLRILSFDIECIGKGDTFPTAKADPVIQIGNTVCLSPDNNSQRRDIFCLKNVSPIPDANVYCFDKEVDLLIAWHEYVRKIDPDIFTGYNIKNFDFPYLIERAEVLKIKNFAYFSRSSKPVRVKDAFFSSKQAGSRNTKEIEIEGRLVFDMYTIINRDFNLRSYTLNAVSVHFLGEQKEDVPHTAMRGLQEGNEETRKRIATYCLTDTYLPMRLFFKLNVLPNYTEMARVTGVPIEYLSSRGQAIKVLSQILRTAKNDDFILPTIETLENDRGYEGGFVMDPEKGYYPVPISVLDFSSLYPSIMISNNLCYTTLLDPKEAVSLIKNPRVEKVTISGSIEPINITEDPLGLDNPLKTPVDFKSISSLLEEDLTAEDITLTPTMNYFVKAHKRVGLLPRILIALLEQRKKARAELKITDEPELKASLNARQMALKISANSVYGFTGAPAGRLPCVEISQSVTSFGREMIAKTKQLIETKYNMNVGFTHNTKVIYGDTDSVMINFHEPDIFKVFELSKEVAAFVSSQFTKPISLEFEKVYFPYLLMNKKRYAGLVYTNPEKPDKIDTKGIETVRRDNCEMVRRVIENCLDFILFKKDIGAAQEYVKNTIRDLYLDKIDLSQLVISKSLTKNESQYSSKQAHVELAEKMRKRDEGSAPVLGDRVGYVIIKKSKGTPAYERSEDPVYVLENNLPIDVEYYIENQLSKPIARLFEPVMDSVSGLLSGEHTRNIKCVAPKKGPLSGFMTKKTVCIQCRAPGNILCEHCNRDFSKHFINFQAQLNEKKLLFSKCWTECQRCQGSVYNEILCVNRVCPIFFMRTKVAKEIEEENETYEKLKKLQW